MAELLARGLREEGHAADVAGTGRGCALDGACGRVRRDRPRRDAARARRLLRCAASSARAEVWSPVLMLTARDAVDDRVAGLDAGADDYLDEAVLVRRAARAAAGARPPRARRAADEARGRRRSASTRPRTRRGAATTELDLSAKEFALLEAFMRRPGEALSRVQLLEAAWDIGFESRSNVVDVYVRYLREKIDRPFGLEHARDGARGRLPAARGRRMIERLPIRLRLTLPFALVMAVLLAATGFFVYHRVGEHAALGSIDQGLRAAGGRGARARLENGKPMLDRDAPGSPSLGEVVRAGRNGDAAQRRGTLAALALRPAARHGARRQAGRAQRPDPRPDRRLAHPGGAGDLRRRSASRSSSRARSRHARRRSTASCASSCSAGALALAPRDAARLRARGGGASPGGGDAPAGRVDRRVDARDAAADADEPRRGRHGSRRR